MKKFYVKSYKYLNTLYFHTECGDCKTEFGDWSECSNGQRTKQEIVVEEAFNGGRECPTLETHSEGEILNKINCTKTSVFIFHNYLNSIECQLNL